MTPGITVLTPRRRRMLTLYLVGYSRREMAAMMGIAPETVRATMNYIRNILGLYSPVELFRWAYAQGLISEWAAADESARLATERKVA
jgi:DNA-binding CsgD family transcriptional regulator